MFGRVWLSASSEPKGVIHLIHGLGEHSGRYADLADRLCEAGYHLASFDLRGHGLSEGQRGHTPCFDYMLDDINLFSVEATQRFEGKLPFFLYGHSLGGNLVLNYALKNKVDYVGVIVTSPALSTTTPPPKIKIALAKLMVKVMPAFSLKNGLETAALSRDEAIVKAYTNDVYVHDTLSARLGMDLLESGQYALNNAVQWTLPLLLMHGTADRITSPEASKQFAEAAGKQVQLVLWEGYYHELHNDFSKEPVIDKLIHWLNEKANQIKNNFS